MTHFFFFTHNQLVVFEGTPMENTKVLAELLMQQRLKFASEFGINLCHSTFLANTFFQVFKCYK